MFKLFLSLLLILFVIPTSFAWILESDFESGTIDERALSSSCNPNSDLEFTSDAGNTYYTNEDSYSGNQALKLTINEGSLGFGSLGGVLNFENCFGENEGRIGLGDEIWVRTRIKFPQGFEFNQNGANKFLRLRTFHEESGSAVSEGYNDLYIDSPPGVSSWGGGDCYLCSGSTAPFKYIFEGKQQWYLTGLYDNHFFQDDTWHTVEYYLKLDNDMESEGGDARIRVWFDGELIGDTGERANLLRADSYINSLYFFTYWDNDGAHLTQSFYVDDLTITTNRPQNQDSQGNYFIGVSNQGSSDNTNENYPSNLVDNLGLEEDFRDGIETGNASNCEASQGNRCWYVDAQALEGGDGTYDDPLNSFEEVLGYIDGTSFVQGDLVGGDYLYVKGNFDFNEHDSVSNNLKMQIYRTTQGGTKANPTVIKSWPGFPRAVFDVNYLDVNRVVDIEPLGGGLGAVHIENIEIQESTSRGISVSVPAQYIEISNVVIKNGIGNGYIGTGGAILLYPGVESHYVVRNSMIINNDLNPSGVQHNRGGVSVLAETSSVDSVVEIKNNVFINESWAIRDKHAGYVDVRVFDNLILDSIGGVWMRNSNHSVYNNIFYNLDMFFVPLGENSDLDYFNAKFFDNIILDTSRITNTQWSNTNYQREIEMYNNLFDSQSFSSNTIYFDQRGVYYNTSNFLMNNNLFNFGNPSLSSFVLDGSTSYNFQNGLNFLNDDTSEFQDSNIIINRDNYDLSITLPSNSPACTFSSFNDVIGPLQCSESFTFSLDDYDVEPGSGPQEPVEDTTSPSQVSGLSSLTQTSNSISLSWSAASDNVGVEEYNIYRNNTLIGSTSSLNYVDSGLSSGTQYSYQISALDSVGNEGARSSSISFSTLNGDSQDSNSYEWEFYDDFEGIKNSSFWLGDGAYTDYGFTDPTNSENKVIRMSYIFNSEGSGDSWSEHDFRLPINATQLEMSFDMYTPSNYYHFERNHKLYALWSGTYGKANAWIAVSSEMWGSNGGATPSVYIGVDQNNYGHSMLTGSPLILEDYAGEWNNYRVYLELAQNESDYGLLEVYKDDVLITSNVHEDIYKSYSSAPEPSEAIHYSYSGNYIDQGTLLGWANGDTQRSYNQDIHFLVDNFSIKANSEFTEVLDEENNSQDPSPGVRGVGIFVDSTYNDPLYDKDNLIDGDLTTSWASSDSSNQHYIVWNFSSEIYLDSLELNWVFNDQTNAYMSVSLLDISYWDGNNYVDLTTIEEDSNTSVSVANFNEISTNSLRFTLEPGNGNEYYNNILWLSEISYSLDDGDQNPDDEDTGSGSSSGSSSGGGSSGGGSSSGGGGSSSSSSSSGSGSQTDTDIPAYEEPVCVYDIEYSDWSECLNGEQFRVVSDNNLCRKVETQERVCELGLDENELKALNAKELIVEKVNSRRYSSSLEGSYNEMVYTSSKLDDDKFILVDNTTQDQYLGRLVEEESGKYYYTLELVDANNLAVLKEEGLAQKTLTEKVGSAFKEFRESRNFISIMVIFSLFGITTIIYFITRYVKRIHKTSSFRE